MHYCELVPNPKDRSPKVMVDLMYKAIDDTCASFNIYFGKQLSLTDPNFGLKFKIIVILMQ